MMRYLGLCAAAAVASPVAQQRASDNANGKGLGRTPPGQQDDDQDDEDEEEEEDEDEEEDLPDPVSNVQFTDQRVEGPTEVGIADRWEQTRKGYLSLHDYNRFEFVEGESAEDYGLEPPQELANPICESMVGITERFDAGTFQDVEVPLLEPDSPAVELGPREAGTLDQSEMFICIPHFDSTADAEFHCPDDPSTPSVLEEPEKVDGAYGEGDQVVSDIGVAHDLGVIFVETDDEERQEKEALKRELVKEGVLVPQPLSDDS